MLESKSINTYQPDYLQQHEVVHALNRNWQRNPRKITNSLGRKQTALTQKKEGNKNDKRMLYIIDNLFKWQLKGEEKILHENKMKTPFWKKK